MLVSKKIVVTTTPVEILAGEELEQAYELLLAAPSPQVVHLGDSSVTVAEPTLADFSPNGATVFRVRGQSLWAVSSTSVTVSVLAYSTD